MANPQLSEGVIRKIHETNESTTDKPLLQVLVVKRIDWGQSTTAVSYEGRDALKQDWVGAAGVARMSASY